MAPTTSNGRSRLPNGNLLRSRVDFAAAVAIAAAAASMLAIRAVSPDAAESRDEAASTPLSSPPTVRTAPIAVDRAPTELESFAGTSLSPDAVEQALAQAPVQRRDVVLSELLAQLTSHDPLAAARIAERQSSGFMREVAMRAVMQSWTRRDAAGALSWANSLADHDERDAALEHAALELAVSEPPLALQALERRSVPRVPDPTLEGVVQQWATSDFAAAYHWVDAQPHGPGRDALLTRLVFVRAGQDPSEAARIASAAFSADEKRIEALSAIAQRWGAQDASAVRELALALDVRARRRIEVELALLE
jgi:hypothetical protein